MSLMRESGRPSGSKRESIGPEDRSSPSRVVWTGSAGSRLEHQIGQGDTSSHQVMGRWRGPEIFLFLSIFVQPRVRRAPSCAVAGMGGEEVSRELFINRR